MSEERKTGTARDYGEPVPCAFCSGTLSFVAEDDAQGPTAVLHTLPPASSRRTARASAT